MTLLNVVGAISKDVSQLKHLLADARCSIFDRKSHSVKTGDLSNINVCFNNCVLKFHRSPDGHWGHHEALTCPSGTVQWAFLTDPILKITVPSSNCFNVEFRL